MGSRRCSASAPRSAPSARRSEKGLLEFFATGGDIDGEQDGDVELYRPTDAGIKLLIESGKIDEQDFRPAVFYALRGLLPKPGEETT